METTVALRTPAPARALWLAVAAGAAAVVAAGVWVILASLAMPVRVAATFGVFSLYAWVGRAAWRMGRARSARLVVADDRLVVEHDGVLAEPIVLDRANVEAAVIDRRSDADRRVAAIARHGGVASSHFLDRRIPVVSGSPSAHGEYPTGSVPNAAVLLRDPVPSPGVPLGPRMLLRVAGGRVGWYAGPRPGKPLRGLRFEVADPDRFAAAMSAWGVLTEHRRDERYLAPLTGANRRRARNHRLAIAAIWLGAALFFVLFAALRGG